MVYRNCLLDIRIGVKPIKMKDWLRYTHHLSLRLGGSGNYYFPVLRANTVGIAYQDHYRNDHHED